MTAMLGRGSMRSTTTGTRSPSARSGSRSAKAVTSLCRYSCPKKELTEYGKDLEAHRARILKERYMPLMTGFPQVRELFQRLIADGKRIALASSAKEDELAHYKKVAN